MRAHRKYIRVKSSKFCVYEVINMLVYVNLMQLSHDFSSLSFEVVEK